VLSIQARAFACAPWFGGASAVVFDCLELTSGHYLYRGAGCTNAYRAQRLVGGPMTATLVDYVALSVNPAATNGARHQAEVAAFLLGQPQGMTVTFSVPDVAGLGDDLYLFLGGYVPVVPLAWTSGVAGQAAFYLMVEGENLGFGRFEEDFDEQYQMLLDVRSNAGVVAALNAWAGKLGRADLLFQAVADLEPAMHLSAEARALFPDDFVTMG
jgi:hypothetical protein